MKKKIIGIFVVMLLIATSIQVAGGNLSYTFCLEKVQSKVNCDDLCLFFDVGVGEPTNITNGDIRILGEDNLFVNVKNNGDMPAFVELDFLLEKLEESEWTEVDSGGKGPYDLDPDVWVESFFDVFYDTEGEYRATFSLDTPLEMLSRFTIGNDWFDDNPDNDVYQAVFTVIANLPDIVITHPRNGLYIVNTKISAIPDIIPGIPVSALILSNNMGATITGSGASYVTFSYININSGANGSFDDGTPPYEWNWGSGNPPGIYLLTADAKNSGDASLGMDTVGVLKIL
ncbi:hypothetical protein MBGDC06_00432 [Thermoplasmatales archaeon SCGC AB-539-C06]|nr:hypothetical protein MBGDC06_00432 [Thermoplasmatales archaeon SCGC AB-539-C06]